MELIIIIVVLVYIYKAFSQAVKNENRQNNANKNPWEGVAYETTPKTTKRDSAKVQVQQQRSQFEKMALENIAKAKERAAKKQIMEGRLEANLTTIVERAKTNADAMKEDVTLETMEMEHNHSERVSAAEHHHPEDVMPESMLGNIDDLMIKGYDGNLCFERDFVGEAMDMISRFTVPSDMPEFSSNQESA